MSDTRTPDTTATYAPARLFSAAVCSDTSAVPDETSRRCPTTQKSGGLWLRYAPHRPKAPRVVDTSSTIVTAGEDS